MSVAFAPVRPDLRHGARPERAAEPPIGRLESHLQGWLRSRRRGAPSMRAFAATLGRIRSRADALGGCDAAVRGRRLRVLREAARSRPTTSDGWAIAVFAHVVVECEAWSGITLHDEQLFAGWSMLHGALVEMRTGEGKTLAAALPAIAFALSGTPVHVVTANDYLAARDAANLGPLYERFGLSVASAGEGDALATRARAYRRDVVYCAARQLVFDYLHDARGKARNGAALGERLRPLLDAAARPTLLRGLCCAIVDEADSVLVDDARTPLVLSESVANDSADRAQAVVALTIARGLHAEVDYRVEPAARVVRLSLSGQDAVRSQTARLGGVWQRAGYREELIRDALAALHLYRRDRDYFVRDRHVVLIDAATGRARPDQKLRRGLQRMLELEEGCELGRDTRTVAALSFQRFFRRYHVLCGMSGTFDRVGAELRTIYRLPVTRVPTHRPCRLVRFPTTIVRDREAQFEALSARLSACAAAGRPVLVGTRSLALAERIGERLVAAGIEHRRLDARQDAAEAEVIGRAGEPGALTLATGIAGRGADIPLDPRARSAGGLHVVNLELQDSPRTERQLFGRAARQGDPGSCESLYCLEDEALTNNVGAGLVALASPPEAGGSAPNHVGTARGPFSDDLFRRGAFSRGLFSLAGRRLAARHSRERMMLFHDTEQEVRQLALAGE